MARYHVFFSSFGFMSCFTATGLKKTPFRCGLACISLTMLFIYIAKANAVLKGIFTSKTISSSILSTTIPLSSIFAIVCVWKNVKVQSYVSMFRVTIAWSDANVPNVLLRDTVLVGVMWYVFSIFKSSLILNILLLLISILALGICQQVLPKLCPVW